MLAAPPISVRLLPPPERCENDNCGSIITDGVAKIVAYSVAWPNRGIGPCATGAPTVVKVSPDWLSTVTPSEVPISTDCFFSCAAAVAAEQLRQSNAVPIRMQPPGLGIDCAPCGMKCSPCYWRRIKPPSSHPLPGDRCRASFADPAHQRVMHREKDFRRPARRGGDPRGHRARAHLHVPLPPAPDGAGGGRAARHGGARAAPGWRTALQNHLLSGFEPVRRS